MQRPRPAGPTITIEDDVPEGHRHSNFRVTLSTLVRPHNPEEEAQLKQLLVDFQKRALKNIEIAHRIFHFNSPDDQIRIKRGTPEKGESARGGRVHVHFSVKTTHAGNYSAPDIQRNLQTELVAFAESQGITLAGAYAQVQIDRSSYWENYAIKEQFGTRVRSGPTNQGYGRILRRELAELEKRVHKRMDVANITTH